MPELKERIWATLGQPLVSSLATLTPDGKPWVRYVVTVADKDLTIRLATFAESRKVQQIRKNSEVHLTCMANRPKEMAPYLQIQGLARFTDEMNERHAFWHETLRNYFDGPDDPSYGIVKIDPYLIEYWSQKSYQPEIWMA